MENKRINFESTGMVWNIEARDNRLYISEIMQGLGQELYVEAAWSILQFKGNSKRIGDSHFYYAARRSLQTFGLPFSAFTFSQKGDFKSIEFVVDGEPIANDQVIRFGFYARTDAGTLVVLK